MLREELAGDQDHLQQLQLELPQMEAARRQVQDELQRIERDLAAGQARRAALEQMQARTQHSGKLPEWLQRHGLDGAVPLWQQIHVAAGWESAVEAVLRERLSAIACDDIGKLDEWLHDRPDARLSVVLPNGQILPRKLRRPRPNGSTPGVQKIWGNRCAVTIRRWLGCCVTG